MGEGTGLYLYVVVVQNFTFAISSPDEFLLQELIRRWDSERELLYDDNIQVEASAYAHWTDLLLSTFYYKYLWYRPNLCK